MADSAAVPISIEVKGFDFVGTSMDAAARMAEAHNKYLEFMTPEQRAKVIDIEIEDRKAFSDFGAPFRELFAKIADAVHGR